MPPTPTTQAPSVLGMCGWVSAPRTALPRVYRPLVCSLGVSAPSRRVVRRTTVPWSNPQSLSTHPKCVPGGRGSITRPLATLHPRTRGVHTERLCPRTSDPCIPARPPRAGQCPRVRHHPNPRHDDAREVHAGRSWGSRTIRCDCPRSQRHRLGVGFYLLAQYVLNTLFIPPLKHTSSTRSRAAAPSSGAHRALRAPVGDAAAPFRWRTGSMDD